MGHSGGGRGRRGVGYRGARGGGVNARGNRGGFGGARGFRGGRGAGSTGRSAHVQAQESGGKEGPPLPDSKEQFEKPDRSVYDKYDPKTIEVAEGSRFFVIKSFTEDDIHQSIKRGIWTSTANGNRRLDAAYKGVSSPASVLLVFSVNGSGNFCGIAKMKSAVDFEKQSGCWAQRDWEGEFAVEWLSVKDVRNADLRHIRVPTNMNKPVPNSRDTQEIPYAQGRQVIDVFCEYDAKTALLDDFGYYDRKSELREQWRKERAAKGGDGGRERESSGGKTVAEKNGEGEVGASGKRSQTGGSKVDKDGARGEVGQ